MDASTFVGPSGRSVTAVTADEMRDIDRVVVEEIGLDLRRMMEHAGRGLAEAVLRVRSNGRSDVPISVLAGNGGNGGGGLACARHLANRDVPVRIVLDRAPSEVSGVTAEQLRILEAMDVTIESPDCDTDTYTALDDLVVDSLIGYGLTGAPRGAAAELIETVDGAAETIVSLDVPSGTNATTGEAPGVAVEPDLTATLALPKTGLATVGGDLRLVDLSIPQVVYDRLEIEYCNPFGGGFAVPLSTR
ncbi:NAD(P)H-hydrate epimerase [Halorubrum sp. SS5]|nr:NAD(P)H-hydrate epimerase [Halorubrum sp. SS7]TKX87709.1 NAD(P)H-hydrate epimerase [Halorubrum sp. SS5]